MSWATNASYDLQNRTAYEISMCSRQSNHWQENAGDSTLLLYQQVAQGLSLQDGSAATCLLDELYPFT
jgi:hypothetical protein